MAITFVQAASGTGSTSATITLSATGAGNCLVACVGTDASTTNGTVSGITLGGAADNWAHLKSAGTNTSITTSEIWADPNCAGSQTSVVVNIAGQSGTSEVMVWVFEFSGVATASVLDQFASFDSGAGTNATFSITTPATTQASEVAVGCASVFNTTITGPGAPWVNETSITGPRSTRTFQAGYDILSSTGTVTYSGSFGATQFNVELVVTLKAPAAAGVNGTVQPWTTVPVPRKPPRRAVAGGPRPFTGFVSVAAPRQPPYLPPRRTLARAYVRGSAPFPGFVSVAAPRQQYRTPPRRVPARAVVQFTPVITTNAAVILGPAGSVPVLMATPVSTVMRRTGRVSRF